MKPEFLRLDHVGYVVRDLAEGAAAFGASYGLEVEREIELPEFSLRAAFLGSGPVAVELIEFLTSELADARLVTARVRLDHVAYEVADLDASAARLRAAGVGLCTPDGREVSTPIEIGTSRHLWTVPSLAPGVCIQLIERKLPERTSRVG